ncbi:hypothetical protein [Salinibaculum salinum]|uniref:hypothetical protein n=1 Tax=Salinibaculum salinum TaxID=3131996 RepID=UPI0030EF4F91
MRHPSNINSERSRSPKSPPGTGGSLVLGLLLVGILVAVSYPVIVGAALLGALSSSLYQRIRQDSDENGQTSTDSVSEQRPQSSAAAVGDRQARRNGNGCCEQV